MRNLMTGGMLALFVAMSPMTVTAQSAPLDEETRATVVMMAQQTAASINTTIEAPAAVAGINAEPEPAPTDTVTALPELNLTDLVEHTSQGVTFLAPADWSVETDVSEGTPFIIEVPGTEVFMSLEADAGLDFPSWLGVALFRSQADLLISELGEDAQLDESTTIFTEQNLPMAKLAFSAADDGEEVGGVLYVVAPNENAYLLVGGGPTEEWFYAAPGIELIAKSIVFDEDLVVVQQAIDAPLTFTDDTLKVTVPKTWYVMSSGDAQFPVMAAEPEVRYVAAIGTEASFGDTFDLDVLNTFLPNASDLDATETQAVLDAILAMIDDAGSPFFVDEDASTVILREGALTVKLVGEADLEQGLSMPIIMFIDLRASGVGIAAIFGEIESALLVEDEIQAMVESINGE